MQRRPGRSQRRVLDWIDQTNASCLGDGSANVLEWMGHVDPPNDPSVTAPMPTRQRRYAMSPTSRRPSSHGTRNFSLPLSKSAGTTSRQTSSTVQHTGVLTDGEFQGDSVYSPESEHAGSGEGSVYSALVVLVSCFLCAALLPSLFVLGLFSVFLTFAPSWSSVQTAQFLPLHREASVISLGTDEEIPEPKDGERNVFDVAFERDGKA
ncbi:hypothetical protein FA13DRAFT_1291782 [Coprinellus micaceus]|uniref:Transmembrane protein n=1 Tax=Coprinellus micaceus TaxID=71717 RepID=A0A4Y7SRY8_COPMI|nr:hypothetical protein FA13DRAFT_1291782 [Coprinellus micaceus]